MSTNSAMKTFYNLRETWSRVATLPQQDEPTEEVQASGWDASWLPHLGKWFRHRTGLDRGEEALSPLVCSQPKVENQKLIDVWMDT